MGEAFAACWECKAGVRSLRELKHACSGEWSYRFVTWTEEEMR